MIRPVTPEDAQAICGIYNYYVLNTVVTFEEEPVSVAEMKERIETVTKDFPWYVYEEDGELIAYAYLHYYHHRSAYRFTVEDSIYVKNGRQKAGIGTQLLKLLIDDAKKYGKHSIMAILGVPNDASEALHKKCGFQKMANMDELGFKFGRWADVAFWKLRIEGSTD
ncbi:MAG: GNAT family N-acetyltransferase [Spirochaetaceae bacterium]|jgi:phosphinothricin acetyltransferase|nr:GNAT family N-acetyltransferase [Spirochaetaceae bacterium]